MNLHILFIDDDEKLQELLGDYFTRKGIQLSGTMNGAKALEFLDRGLFDIIVLDLMLPDTDGFDLLRTIRGRWEIPVIMLTATEDETDRIVGLEMGADDYLHKPINPRELLARIKAIVRRSQPKISHDAPLPPTSAGHIPSTFSFDLDRNQIQVHGKIIDLTTVECAMIDALIRAKGRVVTRDRLMDLARGRDFEAFDRSVDVHISRIRKKIEPDPSTPVLIKTIWGKGYMWEGESID